MVRVVGNKAGRITISDLSDVIYYRQVKEYTDQEFENSRDLQRELNKGSIVIVEQRKTPKGSSEGSGLPDTVSTPAINVNDIRSVIREMLPELRAPQPTQQPVTSNNDVMQMAPLLISMLREEFSKIPQTTIITQNQSTTKQTTSTPFIGPEYIPDVSTKGMTSNIEATKSNVSSASSEDALAALRKIKKLK
jgi:hypothetical protein